MGHAEVACGNDLVDRIARWLDHAVRDPAGLDDAAPPAAALDGAAPDGAALPAARAADPGGNGPAGAGHPEPRPGTSERVPT
jgi:hypothetical protein